MPCLKSRNPGCFRQTTQFPPTKQNPTYERFSRGGCKEGAENFLTSFWIMLAIATKSKLETHSRKHITETNSETRSQKHIRISNFII